MTSPDLWIAPLQREELPDHMSSLRIAVISDIHHGEDAYTKRGSQALRLFDDFVRFVDTVRPDVVLELGDRISDCSHDVDLVLEREVARAFRAIDVPCHHLCGNHDRDFLTVADNEAILGQSLKHEIVDLGAWQLVLWRADTMIRRPEDGSHFQLDDADLAWLQTAMVNAEKPSIVATHVPLSGQSQISNYYFDRNTRIATYPELPRIQAALRSACVPVVCLAGHVHWNSMTRVDGIPHITLQSLTETCTTGGEPAAAWALLEIDDTQISWQASGIEGFSLQLDVASAARRWLTPLPPFPRRKTAAAG
jgi:3',5'-cyclic-AMP phosphodiesterase